jgi:uncharacterized protein YggE
VLMFRSVKASKGGLLRILADKPFGVGPPKARTVGAMVILALVVIAVTSFSLSLAGCSDSPHNTVIASDSASAVSSPNTITVVGDATVKSAPDEAVLTLSVESDGKDPATAMNRNSSSVSAVIERVKREGVKDEDLETANVSVYAVRTYTETGQEKLIGYRATNSILVTVSDAKQVGKILSVAIEAGANSVSGPVWQLSDDTKVVAEALKKAAQNAKQKAEALADSLGVDLGGVVMMSENGVQLPVYPMYSNSYAGKADAAGVVAETPVSAGTLDVTATVTVTFALSR